MLDEVQTDRSGGMGQSSQLSCYFLYGKQWGTGQGQRKRKDEMHLEPMVQGQESDLCAGYVQSHLLDHRPVKQGTGELLVYKFPVSSSLHQVSLRELTKVQFTYTKMYPF